MAKKELTGEEKRKLAMTVMKKFNDDAGDVVVGFAKDVAKKLRFLATPSEEVNAMTGGGWPRGRITEIFGSNSSGKTSSVLEGIGEEMEENPDSYWAWLESEESFDPDYAQDVHGVDLDRLIYVDITEHGAEKSIDRLEALMRAGILTGFVVNSVAGLVPKRELETDLAQSDIALQARMMSKLMRKWTSLIGKKDLFALFINQLRTDVNARFGDPNVTTGGRALAFYASLRYGMNNLKLQDSDPITADDGLKIGARIAKNRCVYDNPYKKCEFYVLYGIGVDKITELINNAPDAGILRKSGAWYYYEKEDGELIRAEKAVVRVKDKDDKKKEIIEEQEDVPLSFNGKTQLRNFMNDNKWFFEQIRDELRGKVSRGEFSAQAQNEEEMKEIEELERIEKEIAADEAKAAKKDKKEKKQKKADAEAEEAPKEKKKPASRKKKKQEEVAEAVAAE